MNASPSDILTHWDGGDDGHVADIPRCSRRATWEQRTSLHPMNHIGDRAGPLSTSKSHPNSPVQLIEPENEDSCEDSCTNGHPDSEASKTRWENFELPNMSSMDATIKEVSSSESIPPYLPILKGNEEEDMVSMLYKSVEHMSSMHESKQKDSKPFSSTTIQHVIVEDNLRVGPYHFHYDLISMLLAYNRALSEIE
jgi:hypothetical protein